MPTATAELTTPTLQAEGPWRLRGLAGPYSHRALVLTAFFGGMGGAAIMAAVNARRVGADRSAVLGMIGVGLVGFLTTTVLLGAFSWDQVPALLEAGNSEMFGENSDARQLFRALNRVVALVVATAWLRVLRAPTRQRMSREDGLEHPNGFGAGLACVLVGQVLTVVLLGASIGLVAGVHVVLGAP